MLLKSPHEDPDVCWSVAETDQLLKTGVGHPAFFGSFSFELGTEKKQSTTVLNESTVNFL